MTPGTNEGDATGEDPGAAAPVRRTGGPDGWHARQALRQVALRVPAIRRRQQIIAEQKTQLRVLTSELKSTRAQLADATARSEQVAEELAAERARRADREREAAVAAQRSTRTGRPSWLAHIQRIRRLFRIAFDVDADMGLPIRALPHKLANYRIASNHGVGTPEIYGVWDTVDQIDLDGLPDTFVLKSDGGAASAGVFPLRRTDEGFARVDDAVTWTHEELLGELRGLQRAKRARPPFFAEELLTDASGSALPVDVKLYCFYGEIGQVLLRGVDEHGNAKQIRRRYLAADGTDLADDFDASVPVPERWEELVGAARRLSLAVPLPFVRVDLYDTPRGVVLGEMTVAPGARRSTLQNATGTSASCTNKPRSGSGRTSGVVAPIESWTASETTVPDGAAWPDQPATGAAWACWESSTSPVRPRLTALRPRVKT